MHDLVGSLVIEIVQQIVASAEELKFRCQMKQNSVRVFCAE